MYGEYHKIKHFACHRDFFVHQIPRIKHTQNASYPGIKHFKCLILFSTNDWLWNVLYSGMKHFAYVLYVRFDAQRNLYDKQNVLFYGAPRNMNFIPYEFLKQIFFSGGIISVWWQWTLQDFHIPFIFKITWRRFFQILGKNICW